MIEVPAGFIKAVALLGLVTGYGVAKSGLDKEVMRVIRNRRDDSVREVARIQYEETKRLKKLDASNTA